MHRAQVLYKAPRARGSGGSRRVRSSRQTVAAVTAGPGGRAPAATPSARTGFFPLRLRARHDDRGSRGERFRSECDHARFRLGQDAASRRRPDAARMGACRVRQADRDRPRCQVLSVDIQRPRPGAHAAGPRRRPVADPFRQRGHAPAHDSPPRHPPGRDGRHAGGWREDWRASHQRRRNIHVRVRSAAVRVASVPLSCIAACGAYRKRDVRHVHRRPPAGSPPVPTSSC